MQPMIGRDFNEQDGKPGTPQVAIAGHTFWRERLGGRADVVGKPVRLDGAEYTLIGVMPPAAGPLDRRFDLFLIQQFTPPPRKGPFFYSVIARLPAGRRSRAGDERASCDQPRAVPDLEVVVPGRQGDVEHGGPQDQPRRQRQHARRPGAGRRRPGVVDRLRECLEPADRARDQPPPGAGRPRRARRHARARAALPAGGKRGACDRRGCAWRRRGVGGHAVVAGAGRHILSAHAGDPLRCADDLVDGRARDLERVDLRPRPGAARHRRIRGCLAAIRANRGGRRRCPSSSPQSRRRAVRHRDAAADRRGLAAHQPGTPAAGRPWLRGLTAADRLDPVAGRALPRQRARQRVLGAAATQSGGAARRGRGGVRGWTAAQHRRPAQ